MTARHVPLALFIAVLLAGCATKSTILLTPQEQYEPETVTVPPMTPVAEALPIDPIEPVPPPSAEQATAQRFAVPSAPLREPPTNLAALVVPAPPAEPSEDQQLVALIADLQRYGAMSADDLRRELANASAALGRQRSDANRVRLAVLYTMVRTTAADDQRALQLFENVAKSNPGPTPIKHLAAVLQVQVTERQKAVRDEQQKADKVIQKLEALREMERSLMRDRVRSGGGGGGGGGAGGGSGR